MMGRASGPARLGLSRLLSPIGVMVLSLLAFPPGLAEPGKDRPRLVVIKVDGLPPDLMAAVSLPERPDLMERLDYADDLRKTIRFYREQTGRQVILPNIRKYFFEEGAYVENAYSETVTLSAVAWSVVDTGQPSVVKGHGTFSRDTCYLRSHLDGLRDNWDALFHGESKTAALWNLDQVGVGLMQDAFDPSRTWTSPQIYRRIANWETLGQAGKRWLHNDQEGWGNIARSHVSRLVTGIDYIEFNQEVSGLMTMQKVLERDLGGTERFDYIGPFFTLMDHQQHIDPHPENLIHWLVKLDRLVGGIFRSVEQSSRRDETIVAMVSDHGSEISPGDVAFSFPITRVFRTPIFGGHNVKTLLVESAWNAVSTPVPGWDFPRVYESRYSPFGEKAHPGVAEGGYVTCFIDSFGNARSAVHLRNNDLNRLHLILLELKKQPVAPERFSRLRELFRETLRHTRRWLEPDLRLWEDYGAGARDLASHLAEKVDEYSKDVAWRLEEEAERDAQQLRSLGRLLNVGFAPGDGQLLFDDVFSRPFRISDFIPKQYLGQPNSIHQLSHYTVGLSPDLMWVENTVDAHGNPTPMNYFEVMTDFEAANAPVNGRRNPFDLVVAKAPVEPVREALQARGLIEITDRLRNVAWVKSTAKGNPRKGGEALIVESMSGPLKYIPVGGLRQAADGSVSFSLVENLDPLGLVNSRDFTPRTSLGALAWMHRFHPRQQWLEAIHRTEYSTAVNMIIDIINDPTPEFIDSPEFQKYLIYFSSDELKERYLRGLKRKYATQVADFVVWAEELWNFNSKARTSGGSHAGLRPIVARTAFVVWGGDATGIARGRTVSEVATTLDIAPTLFRALGMLDQENQIIRDPASIPERTLHRLPGKVVDIWKPVEAGRTVSATDEPNFEN